jgi:hypothetical protein
VAVAPANGWMGKRCRSQNRWTGKVKQMSISIQLDRAKKMLVIKLPVEKLRLSSSGKSELVASSHGLQSGEALFRGKPIMVVANAFIFADKQAKSIGDKSRLKPKSGRKAELLHNPIEQESDEE